MAITYPDPKPIIQLARQHYGPIRQALAFTALRPGARAATCTATDGWWSIRGLSPVTRSRALELDGQPARLSILTPNGDIIANLPDNTLVRYRRSDRAP